MPCHGVSLPSVPSGWSSSQRAVCVILCALNSEPGISEVRRDFSLLSIIVKVRQNAEEYLGCCQALFDPFLLLL